jgi:hypothetical protein
MKTSHSIHRFAGALSFLALTTLSLSSFAGSSVLLDVDMKGTHTPHSGSSSAEVHHRWLEITVTPMHLDQPISVDVEWTFFSKDLTAEEITTHVQKTETVQLTSGQPVHLRSADTIFSYVREHGERVSGSRKSRYKKVPASGDQYHGWAVRALIDGQVSAEAFSHPALAKKLQGSN